MVVGGVVRLVRRAFQRGPRRIGDRITEAVPGLQRVRNPLNRVLSNIPFVGSIMGAAAGSILIGLAAMYVVYVAITSLVM